MRIRCWAKWLVVLGVVCVLVSDGFAQDRSADLDFDVAELQALRAEVEQEGALEEDQRARLVSLLDEAIGALQAARQEERETARVIRQRVDAERLAEGLRQELSTVDPAAAFDVPDGIGLEQAESLLERERSKLEANWEAVRELDRLAEGTSSRRTGFSRELGTLDQKLDALSDELRTADQSDASGDVKRAVRYSVVARRHAAQKKAALLRAQLTLLAAQSALIPAQIDHAQRRVSVGEHLVSSLGSITEELRRQRTRQLLADAHQRAAVAIEEVPPLAPVADEVRELAELVWGAGGVVSLSERAEASIGLTRKHQSDLERIINLTRRKFQAFGYRGSLTRWWPVMPVDFPGPGDLADDLRDMKQSIPEVQHRLIGFEEKRAAARGFERSILESLVDAEGLPAGAESLELAQSLLLLRRQLLDDLIQSYGRYETQLVQLETSTSHFLEDIRAVQSWLYERLLWIRSVPRPIIPRAADLRDAAGWVFGRDNWVVILETIRSSLSETPGRSQLILMLLVLLVAARRLLRRRLVAIGKIVSDPQYDRYHPTVRALIWTVLLTAPLPLALWFGSELLSAAVDSPFAFAASWSLAYLVAAAAVLEFGRQLLAPSGLAECHFGWPTRLTGRVWRGLFWPEIAFLAVMFVSLLLAGAGMRLNSPGQLQTYNNSLGRIAFIAALAILGLALGALFQPRIRFVRSGDQTPPIEKRLALILAPLNVLTTLLPAVLAAAGFYISAVLLAYQMQRTLWLLLILAVSAEMLRRWLGLHRERSARLHGSEDPLQSATLAAATASAERVRELIRFALGLVLLIGLFSIWSDALPVLRMLRQVQIWPTVQVVPAAERLGPSLLADGPRPQPTADVQAEAGGGAESEPKTPISGLTPHLEAQTELPATSLSLWSLIQSILALIVTFMLVRAVPALLDLIIRGRTRVDAGVRIAITTLVRYTLVILGVSVSFSFLGISWSKIQWLAAALTFGLGFGLQEIVANFISGLILLVERPVRVGDAVTVGTLQGRVSRIQIRATTITLWDRSEMIVPNKEFVTTKLINWTLSDSRRRIGIPIRVAYGSDPAKLESLLLETTRKHPLVLADPAAHVLLLEFGEHSLKFELRFFVEFGDGLQTKHDLHVAINQVFQDNGIEFALPKLELGRLPEE